MWLIVEWSYVNSRFCDHLLVNFVFMWQQHWRVIEHSEFFKKMGNEKKPTRYYSISKFQVWRIKLQCKLPLQIPIIAEETKFLGLLGSDRSERQTSRCNTNTFYCFLIIHTTKWLVQVKSVISSHHHTRVLCSLCYLTGLIFISARLAE